MVAVIGAHNPLNLMKNRGGRGVIIRKHLACITPLDYDPSRLMAESARWRRWDMQSSIITRLTVTSHGRFLSNSPSAKYAHQAR